MQLRKLITIILILTYQIALADESDKQNQGSGKVVIYYFKDNSRTNDYSYYSYVVPDSIAVDIKKTEKYQVQTFPVTLRYVNKDAPENILQNHIRMLADRGKKFSAEFIITGSYFIKNRKIFIKTQIFNVKKEELTEIKESSTELGALLFVILDEITEKINSELDKSYIERRESIAKSPFIPIYNTISGISFGISYGTVNFLGEWGELYDNADITTIYLNYDLSNLSHLKENRFLKSTAVSILFDYFNNDIRNHRSSLSVWGITFNFIYLYRLSNSFVLTPGAGIGGTKTDLIVRDFGDGEDGDDIFNSPESRDKSFDPYLNLSLSTKMIFDPVEISFGIAYRRILYSDKHMGFSVIFFGFGYRI